MNKWSKKTLEIVCAEDYLDKLQKIYPHEDAEREINEGIIELVQNFYEEKDDLFLLDVLLNLEKFPYKESYVAFLRKSRTVMKKLITHRWIPQDGFRVHRCKFCGVVRHWDGGYQRLMFKWTGGQGYAPPKCKRTIHSDKTL